MCLRPSHVRFGMQATTPRAACHPDSRTWRHVRAAAGSPSQSSFSLLNSRRRRWCHQDHLPSWNALAAKRYQEDRLSYQQPGSNYQHSKTSRPEKCTRGERGRESKCHAAPQQPEAEDSHREKRSLSSTEPPRSVEQLLYIVELYLPIRRAYMRIRLYGTLRYHASSSAQRRL
jgi:hypothetical protein